MSRGQIFNVLTNHNYLCRLSGCVLVSRLQVDGGLGFFQVVTEKMKWAEAQSYCRAKFTDLATIPDWTTNAEVQQVAGRGKFWIGLFNTSWRWSLGNEDVSLSSWFTKWGPAEPRPGYCVTITGLGLWFVRDCTVQFKFFCYDGELK